MICFALLSACARDESVSVINNGENLNNGLSNTASYTVSGTVKGNFSDNLKLQLNNKEIITVADHDTSFIFSQPVSDKYYVKISRQPNDAQCIVSNSYGNITSDVQSIIVSCTQKKEASALSIAQIDVAQIFSHPIDPKEDFQFLVPHRKALVRAYVYAPPSSATTPPVTLMLNGNSQTMTCPSFLPSNIPTYPIRTYHKSDTCYATINADLVKSGLALTVTADDVSLQRVPNISKKKTLDLVLVPLRLNNTTPVIDDAKLLEIRTQILRTMPFSVVNVTKRSAWDTRITNFTINASNSYVLELVLQELEILRLTETASNESDKIYFGIIPISTLGRGAIVSGLAYCNDCNRYSSSRSFSAIGLDFPDTWLGLSNPDGSPGWSRMILHEIGHTLSLLHAPCIAAHIPTQGFEQSKDLLFPYSGGTLGEAPIYDQTTEEFIHPSGHTDLMGYCTGEWLSDYHVYKINQFTDKLITQYIRNPIPFGKKTHAINSGADHQESLLIVGTIKNISGKLQAFIEPVQTLASNAMNETTLTRNGEYQLRVITTEGRIFDYAFDTVYVADSLSNQQHFFLRIPKSDIAALVIRENHAQGKTLPLHIPKKSTNIIKSLEHENNYLESLSNALVTIDEQDQKLYVNWNHVRYPWLQLMYVEPTPRHSKRIMIAQNIIHHEENPLVLDLPLLSFGGYWEVSLSNGLKSIVQRVERKKP